jgi:hypothetical protein
MRQYDRCVAALQQELGVAPSDCTVDLHRRISAGQCTELTAPRSHSLPAAPEAAALSDVVTRLERLEAMLADIQRAVQRDLRIVKRTPVGPPHDRERQPVRIATAVRRERQQKRAADG